MNVLAIIDSFKGTISSKRLGDITKEVLGKRGHNVDSITIADGGEGFLEAFEDILKDNCHYEYLEANDPIFRNIETCFLVSGETAYVELAKVSGINLLKKDELNPFIASTYGLGEVIDCCIKKGFKKIVIGIGGSATNDCGVGMLEALGMNFYDENDIIIKEIRNKDFNRICRIDDTILKNKINGIDITVLSDVSNPLLGEYGATHVFSRQKGAKESDLERLENNIKCFSKFKKEFESFPGSGAAGGVGYALKSYLNAKFYSGIDYILDLIKYEDIVKRYDYIITGEGKVDMQSLLGKVVFKISERSNGKKVIVVCGINEIENIDLDKYNVYKIESIVNENVKVEDSINNPEKYYKELVERIKLD